MLNTFKALIVDDEPLIRFNLAEELSEAGFEILEAGSADEAIGVLERGADIHVVFTDIQMPGSMDGIELAHFIRRRWPPTVLIVTSGRKRPSDAELPPGASFLPKPHHPVDLANLLNDVSARLNAH